MTKRKSSGRQALRQAVAMQHALRKKNGSGGGGKKRQRQQRPPQQASAPAAGAVERASGEAELIARFHTIQKELSRESESEGVSAERREALQRELEELGGLETYQKASLSGETSQAEFDSSAWVLGELCRRRGRLFADLGLASSRASLERMVRAAAAAAAGALPLGRRGDRQPLPIASQISGSSSSSSMNHS